MYDSNTSERTTFCTWPITFGTSDLHFLPPSQVHWLGKQWEDVGVKSLPVRIVEVILLRRLLLVSLHNSKLCLVLEYQAIIIVLSISLTRQ